MPSLNTAQQQAVEYLDGPLLVLAGPGTGKTQLLSAKVAYILENTDTDPTNILCLTFTDAGAQNMRDRLRSMIGPSANGVNIHTYHAFGSDLLAQYKNYATEFDRTLDSPIDTVTQYKIIKQIQNNLPALDLFKTSDISDIINTISSAKSARLSAADLEKIATYNEAASQKLNKAISPILRRCVPRMKFNLALDQVYTPLLETLLQFSSDQPIIKNIEPEVNPLARQLKDLIDTENAKEKPSVSPLTKWRNANFELDSESEYRLKNLVPNKKLHSLANIMSQYDETLRADGLFDFADMIEEAIRILKTDTGFRLTLSERYQYILLDEFQDTNPSQFELIRLLTDYERPNVMAVGDDDQAIFAFQGANASNLLDFQSAYSAEVVTLTENYRSTQEILDTSHKIATQISDSFARHHHTNKILTAVLDQAIRQLPSGTPDSQNSTTYITRHEFPSADTEYYWVASKIHDLIKSGESQSDIAIITPKHKYIAPLLPYLKAYDDLNISYEKRENILEDPTIQHLAELSRFVHETASGKNADHRLLKILSDPSWKLNPVTIISALRDVRSTGRPALEVFAKSPDQSLQAVATFLGELVASSFTAPLEQILSQMLHLDDPDPTNDFATFHTYELLSVLRENIKSHTKAQSPKLKDFVDFLDDYESAGEAIINTSPYQDDSNSVQIMTAHKSKGLEFKHVFLVATDNLSWGKAKGNNNKLTLPSNLIQIRHTGITDDERLRLFFVALTRAKQTLTITNSKKDYAGKTPARLDYLEEYDGEDGPISPLLPEQTIIVHGSDISDSAKQSGIKYQWLSAYQTYTPDLLPILQQRASHIRLTATDLTTFIDLVYAGPMEYYKRKILGAPSDPATDAIIFGNLIHETFEAVTSRALSDEDALTFFTEKADEAPLSPEEQASLKDKGIITLKASLNQFGDILRHPTAKAEVNFSPEHLFFDNIPLTGKIDHLNLDKDQKTIEVYDFKTGPYHPEKWQSHATLYKYALQLEFYKLLLNLSPTYRNYQVNTGHILFVSPDPTTLAVYDKPYEYTTRSADEFKSLLRAVYGHITSLDFLAPDSPLCLYPDNSRRLKDIKDFVALLLSDSPTP